jgi:hypothetical protein
MLGLSFLSPLFLVGALAAGIPIVLHLFNRRADPVVDFSATRYLQQEPVEQSSRRRVKELILLALRVAALVLLAVAFARPYLSSSAVALSAPATVVLLDTSLSLSAPGQFERARALAQEQLRTAPPTHLVALIAFNDDAEVVSALGADRRVALEALARLAPGYGATRYGTAMSRGAEVIGSRPGRLVVVSDLQRSGWTESNTVGVPEGIAVEVEDAGGPSGNVAVTALRSEADEAVAVVENFSRAAISTRVVLTVNRRDIGTVPVSVERGGTAEARLPLAGATSGTLTASVDDAQGYAGDNVRYMALGAASRPSVVAITTSGRAQESYYLEHALGVSEGTGGFQFRAMSVSTFSNLASDALETVDVIAILGTRGLERQGRERLARYVRSGGGILLAAGPDVEPDIIKDALRDLFGSSWSPRSGTPLRLAPDDGRHPIFRIFGGTGALGNVAFERTVMLTVTDTASVVARYSDGSPALVEERNGMGRMLVFASDLNHQWNDFPVQPAFVPFVHELFRYLALARAARTEYFVGEVPGASGAMPGVVDLQSATGNRPSRTVSVNVDPRESNPDRMTADAFQHAIARVDVPAVVQSEAETREHEDTQRLWQYGLILMAIGLVAEGLLGRRLV